MPRFEYIDHEGRAHVITADTLLSAQTAVFKIELDDTYSPCLADRAAGTVELSDERGRAR